MSIIISHIHIGKAFPHAAAVFDDENHFIDTVNSIQLDGEELVHTVDDAIKYVENAFSNVSKIITRDNYVIGESDLIDEKANSLGWNDNEKLSA